MKLEDKLIQLRKEKGLSQSYVADAMDISRQAISRWEVGIALPSTENLRKLAELYGVSIDVLLNESVDLSMRQGDQQITEAVFPPDGKKSDCIQHRFRGKKIVYGSIAVAVALLLFWTGYLIGQANVEQVQNEPIPLSELETMDFDFSDAQKSTIGWPDFVEGGE